MGRRSRVTKSYESAQRQERIVPPSALEPPSEAPDWMAPDKSGRIDTRHYEVKIKFTAGGKASRRFTISFYGDINLLAKTQTHISLTNLNENSTRLYIAFEKEPDLDARRKWYKLSRNLRSTSNAMITIPSGQEKAWENWEGLWKTLRYDHKYNAYYIEKHERVAMMTKDESGPTGSGNSHGDQ